ncbi:hypothetical protein D3C73_1277820 [compost metagenome]
MTVDSLRNNFWAIVRLRYPAANRCNTCISLVVRLMGAMVLSECAHRCSPQRPSSAAKGSPSSIKHCKKPPKRGCSANLEDRRPLMLCAVCKATCATSSWLFRVATRLRSSQAAHWACVQPDCCPNRSSSIKRRNQVSRSPRTRARRAISTWLMTRLSAAAICRAWGRRSASRCPASCSSPCS